jgi:hypothetical protein
MLDLVMGCSLGLVQGLRHALEPDHLTAVSVMLAEQRSLRASVRLALAWGLGHGLTLLTVSLALFALERQMPRNLADTCELIVALTLIFLGARALAGARRHRKEHEPFASAQSSSRPTGRPLLVGLLHGLAGSGALSALALTRGPSLASVLAFMLVYALGACAGMAALAGLLGAPLAQLHRHAFGTALLLSSGLGSAAFGVMLAAPIAARWWL